VGKGEEKEENGNGAWRGEGKRNFYCILVQLILAMTLRLSTLSHVTCHQ